VSGVMPGFHSHVPYVSSTVRFVRTVAVDRLQTNGQTAKIGIDPIATER